MTLTRIKQTPEGTWGLLKTEVGTFPTIEPPRSGEHPCLHPGTYSIGVTYSPKFERPLPILYGTGDRKYIRIHAGSRPAHSQGCILVSRTNEKIITDYIRAETAAHRFHLLTIIGVP